MGRVADILVRDLRELLSELGRDGGWIGPSVYDTAMVARLAPPKEGPEPALDWLLSQQQSDGGWCSPRFPIGRDLPTLAAALALRELRKDARGREACAAGLSFLRRQAAQWTVIPEDLPIALELTLPALVAEAIRLGVDISPEPYRLVAAEGERKRKRILRAPVMRGTPAAYAWEGLGLSPTDEVVDAIGSVGTSPAATAAWLSAAGDVAPSELRASAARFLQRAWRSTGCGVPGVVPHAFPIDRFEQSWSLFAALVSNVSDLPAIHASMKAALDELQASLRPDGASYSDVFMVDGDDTASSVAVLKAAGRDVDPGLVRNFEGDGKFFCYPGERNPSISVNALALHALSLFGQDSPGARGFLVSCQSDDGRFLGEKWQSSWLYTTHRAVLALRAAGDLTALEKVMDAMMKHQHADGGFGAGGVGTRFETAHGLLIFKALRERGLWSDETRARSAGAQAFLLQAYRPFGPPEEPLWIGKELYSMPRVDKAFELAAMLEAALELPS